MVFELYRSDNILVRCIPATERSRWAVTFDHLAVSPGLDREGFGERFFHSRGISLITVLGATTDWYQYPEITEALAAVRAHLASAARVMTYGSSMGGYAAIRFADLVGATASLALSPQYSVDPCKVPFEERWNDHGTRITWRPELAGPHASQISPVIVYDSSSNDRRHAEMIAAETPITAIPIRFAGHPVGTFLNSVRLLEALVLDVLDGRFHPAAFTAEIDRVRHSSPVWISELAVRQPKWRPRTGRRLAERAFQVHGGNGFYHIVLAKCLLADDQAEIALAHCRAAENDPEIDMLTVGTPLSEALARCGYIDEAIAIVRQIISGHPHMAAPRSWLADLLRKSGCWTEAAQQARAASKLAPGNAHYRKRLNVYRPLLWAHWRQRIIDTRDLRLWKQANGSTAR